MCFEQRKQKPGLKFNPGLTLIGLQATRPRLIYFWLQKKKKYSKQKYSRQNANRECRRMKIYHCREKNILPQLLLISQSDWPISCCR